MRRAERAGTLSGVRFWRRAISTLAASVVLALMLAGQALASGGSLSGTIVYADMTPASQVLVFIVPAHVTGPVQTYETITSAQGEWSYNSIPAGEYLVSMIVVPASGTHETRVAKSVHLEEGQTISLGTIAIGAPAISEARTRSAIFAEGTLTVVVKTAEGLPATGALLTIQAAAGGGGTGGVPPTGVLSQKLRNGPVALSATDTRQIAQPKSPQRRKRRWLRAAQRPSC